MISAQTGLIFLSSKMVLLLYLKKYACFGLLLKKEWDKSTLSGQNGVTLTTVLEQTSKFQSHIYSFQYFCGKTVYIRQE